LQGPWFSVDVSWRSRRGGRGGTTPVLSDHVEHRLGVVGEHDQLPEAGQEVAGNSLTVDAVFFRAGRRSCKSDVVAANRVVTVTKPIQMCFSFFSTYSSRGSGGLLYAEVLPGACFTQRM
jgi:hypothetical protein